MRETVTREEIEEIKARNDRNSETELSVEEDGLLCVKIDGQEYRGLTPQEVASRFGTNYNLMQQFRYTLNNDEAEQLLAQEQSLKSELIDIFMQTLEQNNIFEGKLSLEEVRERLEKNIDAVYVVDEGYREKIRWMVWSKYKKYISNSTK